MEIMRVSGGGFRLDGGSMFGVVPKVLWERHFSADELNRIRMNTNCVLVKTPLATVLIDTGYGTAASLKQRKRMAMAEGNPLLDNLALVGVAPDDIDLVILTHLHFDHVGGCTYRDSEGSLLPTFPRAKHVVQNAEWQDAVADLPELRGAYSAKELQVLAQADLVQIVDGKAEVTQGVFVEPTGGHTRGHQVVVLDGQDRQAIYISELCPTTAHLHVYWTMAYDQDLLQVRRAKKRLLDQAVVNRQVVLFNHDPEVAAARIGAKSKIEFSVEETISI
jgi:glyoxylase-like metal-dependent hydrolase (beta-lactamase superfamily II)